LRLREGHCLHLPFLDCRPAHYIAAKGRSKREGAELSKYNTTRNVNTDSVCVLSVKLHHADTIDQIHTDTTRPNHQAFLRILIYIKILNV